MLQGLERFASPTLVVGWSDVTPPLGIRAVAAEGLFCTRKPPACLACCFTSDRFFKAAPGCIQFSFVEGALGSFHLRGHWAAHLPDLLPCLHIQPDGALTDLPHHLAWPCALALPCACLQTQPEEALASRPSLDDLHSEDDAEAQEAASIAKTAALEEVSHVSHAMQPRSDAVLLQFASRVFSAVSCLCCQAWSCQL